VLYWNNLLLTGYDSVYQFVMFAGCLLYYSSLLTAGLPDGKRKSVTFCLNLDADQINCVIEAKLKKSRAKMSCDPLSVNPVFY
jgi:hypothetical protein